MCRHAFWTLPLSALLSVLYWLLRTSVDAYRVAFLISIAVVYTIPWDSYLIRHDVRASTTGDFKTSTEMSISTAGMDLPTRRRSRPQTVRDSGGGAVLLCHSDVHHVSRVSHLLKARPPPRLALSKNRTWNARGWNCGACRPLCSRGVAGMVQRRDNRDVPGVDTRLELSSHSVPLVRISLRVNVRSHVAHVQPCQCCTGFWLQIIF